MSDKVYFFGCNPASGAGHYLYESNFNKADTKYDMRAKLFDNFDGVLVGTGGKPYNIDTSYFEGIAYKAYSYVDYSVDKRGGSNSNLFVPYKLEKYSNGAKEEFEYQLKVNFPTLHALYKKKDIRFYLGFDDDVGFKLQWS